MKGMLFAVSVWARGLGMSMNTGSFRVPCNCVLEAISLSAANVNDGIAGIQVLDIMIWDGHMPSSGAVTWVDRTDWFGEWTYYHGPNVRLQTGQIISVQLSCDDLLPEDVMIVLYFREG